MGLSNKWTFIKTQNKKSLEHQALQICSFGVNQANIEQDIYSHMFNTLKTYQENCLDIYNFYQILEIFIGRILFNIGLAIT